MKKWTYAILPVLLLVMVLSFGKPVKAEGEFKLDETSYTFTGSSSSEAEFYTSEDTTEKIAKAVSSNTKIVKVSEQYGTYIALKPVATGTATVTVTGKSGSTATLKVTVKDSYFKNQFTEQLEVRDAFDTSKKVIVCGLNGTSGTLKIHKKTYKFSIGSSEKKTIKLKKACLYGEKYTLTAKKGKYSKTIKGKVTCNAKIRDAKKKSSKSIKVYVYDLYKGQTVSIKYKGKTYTKKIKKKTTDCWLTFKTKKKITKNAKMTLTIKNKKKKKMYTEKIVLTNGYYDAGWC